MLTFMFSTRGLELTHRITGNDCIASLEMFNDGITGEECIASLKIKKATSNVYQYIIEDDCTATNNGTSNV